MKTKKKVFAENWSVFSPKSGEDQKKKVVIAIWDYIRPEFVGFIRAGWLLIVSSSSFQISMGGRLNLDGGMLTLDGGHANSRWGDVSPVSPLSSKYWVLHIFGQHVLHKVQKYCTPNWSPRQKFCFVPLDALKAYNWMLNVELIIYRLCKAQRHYWSSLYHVIKKCKSNAKHHQTMIVAPQQKRSIAWLLRLMY